MSYDILINNQSCVSLKMFPVRRPNINSPQKKYKEYDVLGRNGKLYQDLGLYEDVEVVIEFNYLTNDQNFYTMFRTFKKLIYSAKTLIFSDDAENYHRIKKVEIGTNERITKKLGRFDVTFIMDPYTYRVDGAQQYNINQVLYNSYDESLPLYYITGEGLCTLTVNGNEVTLNVGQNVYIDTSLEIAYRTDGESQSTMFTADYSSLRLLPGNNTITVTEGFNLKITPNWRVI